MKTTQTTYYLDHAAATPLDTQVAAAMRSWREDKYINASSVYGAARETSEQLATARAQVANVLGAKPTEIIFTSGATEADNLAVQGVLRASLRGGFLERAHWVTSSIEHDAVLAQCAPLAAQGFPSTIVPVQPNGLIQTHLVADAITPHTVLVSVMLANNELGTVQPLRELARIIQDVRAQRLAQGNTRPLLLHTDAAQAGNYLDLRVDRLGIDLMTLNAAKLYGPKGAGVLYVRTGTMLEPLLYGGQQERGLRSGTVDVAAAVGMAVALEQAQVRRQQEATRLEGLRDSLQAQLVAAIPGIKVNGTAHRLPNLLNITVPGAEGQAMVLYLDNVGIMAATGSACSADSLEPSHVLQALGRSREEARCSLRFSLGRSTEDEAIHAVAQHLPPIVERLRAIG